MTIVNCQKSKINILSISPAFFAGDAGLSYANLLRCTAGLQPAGACSLHRLKGYVHLRKGALSWILMVISKDALSKFQEQNVEL